jgi:hypothetical protein
MTPLDIKKEIRICKKNLETHYEEMKQWIEDPEAYLIHSRGDERENTIVNAACEFGRLNAWLRLKRISEQGG